MFNITVVMFSYTISQTMLIVNYIYLISAPNKKIFKVPRFYERIAPLMPPRVFRRYFRMYEETLNSLTNYLSNYISTSPTLYQPPRYVRITLPKKIAMTTAYFGSSIPTFQ